MKKALAAIIIIVVVVAIALLATVFKTPSDPAPQPAAEDVQQSTEAGRHVDERLSPYAFDWDTYSYKDEQWWRSQESMDLAAELVASQQPDGGWRKDVELAPGDVWANSTIDNNMTWGQINYLAKSYSATGDTASRDACLRGIDYLLDSQYDNGGWPAIAGVTGVYQSHVTFNDDAMVGVMRVMRAVANQSAEDGFAWVDDAHAQRAQEAFDRGLECTLDCQITVDGRLTAWAQQYDEVTLQPATGRAYEPPAISAKESVGVVEFLQSLPAGDPRIKASIDAALTWFDDMKMQGLRYEEADGVWVVVEGSPNDYLWARFYDLESSVPIFSDHDGQIYYDLSEVSEERRAGYEWYGNWPMRLMQNNSGA